MLKIELIEPQRTQRISQSNTKAFNHFRKGEKVIGFNSQVLAPETGLYEVHVNMIKRQDFFSSF